MLDGVNRADDGGVGFVEVQLGDRSRSDRVAALLLLLVRQPALRHPGVRELGCLPFVDKDDPPIDPGRELGRERADELGTRALGAVHVEGDPEHDLGFWAGRLLVELLDDRVDEQSPVLLIDGDLDQPRGRRDAGDPIREREPGAFVPKIDREDAHGGLYLQSVA